MSLCQRDSTQSADPASGLRFDQRWACAASLAPGLPTCTMGQTCASASNASNPAPIQAPQDTYAAVSSASKSSSTFAPFGSRLNICQVPLPACRRRS